MIKKILALILVIMTVAVLSAGCNNGNQQTTGQSGTSEPSTDAGTAGQTSAVTDQKETQPAEEAPIEYKDSTDLILADYNTGNISETGVFEFKGGKDPGPFSFVRDGKSEGSKIILPKDTVGGMSTAFSMSETSVTEYNFDLHSSNSDHTYGWFTCYFGCRLEGEQADPLVHTGVWLAMRDHQLGIRKGEWPNTSYTNVDYDFASGEHIRIVDDPTENIIKIYAGNDGKEIAYVKIDGKKIELYKTGEEKPALIDNVTNEIKPGGYAHLWNHITDTDTTAENFKVSAVREVGNTDNNGIKPNTRDLFADTWTATDDVGRTLTTAEAPAPNGAKVGIFYFLWHETSNNGKPLYDHTASYEKGGIDELWKTLQSGSLGYVHYWAEPYFGYYASDDEWVIRKHGTMLAEAGIDFVFFDATNGPLYPHNYTAVMRVWSQMRKEGTKTPDVCFILKGDNAAEMNNIWAALYEPGLYEDLWFRWNGKPVIMFTNKTTGIMTSEQKAFFTVRYSWANEDDKWYTGQDGRNCWAWGTMYPQKGGFAGSGKNKTLEQMVVMCGFWANGSYGTNAGRSYTYATGEPKDKAEGAWDMGFGLFNTTSGLGLAYQEQFDRAIEQAPKVIMITGWNEWWAGRWEGDAAGQTIGYEYIVSKDPKVKEYNYYVDNLNPEYSRDIEPMKDGFNDNYYYQTVDNVRKYKGARTVQTAFGQKTVNINGSLTQWYDIGPEYRDAYGDTAHRDHLSHVGGLTYTNDTGRNDILTAKVSGDGEYLYFYVECADDITRREGNNWMNLFIDSNGDTTDGWEGYNYVINREMMYGDMYDGVGRTSVERFTDGWSFEQVGDAEITGNGKVMVIKVKKSLVGCEGDSFNFKWADNSVNDGDIMGFLDKGDAAPDGRFCYRYTTAASETAVPACLTADMVVLKANGYNAYVNGKQVMIIENSTKATLLASGYDFYLPVQFLKRIGINCDGQERYDHYGVKYVKANDAVSAAGKTVTVTPDGLLIIADAEITDTETLDTLFRALS